MGAGGKGVTAAGSYAFDSGFSLAGGHSTSTGQSEILTMLLTHTVLKLLIQQTVTE